MAREVGRVELAYAAGFIDGEGCFDACRVGRSHVPRLQVGQAHLEVIQRMQRLFGGSIYRAPRRASHHQALYVWRLQGSALARLLEGIEPYLIVKKHQAAATLWLLSRRHQGVRIAEEEFARREQCSGLIRRWNRGLPHVA